MLEWLVVRYEGMGYRDMPVDSVHRSLTYSVSHPRLEVSIETKQKNIYIYIFILVDR